MIIEKHTVVTVHYKLQRDNADGDLIEQTHGTQPLVFLFGIGQMISKFEEHLAGKKVGDSLAFPINHLEAYGPVSKDVIVPIPISSFMVDGKLVDDYMQVGKTIPMTDKSGRQLYGKVIEIKEDAVTMDFNHPMAGVNLYFSVDVQDIRPATAAELENGQVHGPGGPQ